MEAQVFAQKWKKTPLRRFSLSAPLAAYLNAATADALRTFGLPETAEPWLAFMEFSGTDAPTAAALKELNVFPIGYLPNGDIIVIEKETDRVVILDHENLTDAWLLNTSLEALYESLWLFDRFIAEVNRRNPGYASDFRIPEGMLDDFQADLTACDAEAITSGGFWYNELRALDDRF